MNEDGTLITYKLKFMDSYRFKDKPLPALADNFSEINKCKCKNPNEQCIHTKRKNDVLICTCKTCNNKSYISIDTLRERSPHCTNLVKEKEINSYCYYEKLFILTITWIAVKDLMKQNYQIKNHSTTD